MRLQGRYRADEHPGVFVARALQNLEFRAELHQPAFAQHGDAVRDVGHHAEIMRNEKHPMPWRRCSSAMRRKICACVVTSSAVVGSSAMSSAGSSASAMAIMMRWRWPPES